MNPLLTIYVPTIGRTEIVRLFSSMAAQLSDKVEVVVSDNSYDGRAYEPTVKLLGQSPARVEYSHRESDIGGDPNIVRGFTAGTAPWLWIIGDDDIVLPNAIPTVLSVLSDDVDRIILLSQRAPRSSAGFRGSIADLAKLDASLIVAATLISANVVRRSKCDVIEAWNRLDTHYGHAWAWRSLSNIVVAAQPCIGVGTGYANAGIEKRFELRANIVKQELLHGYGLDVVVDDALLWNFISVER